MLTRQIKSVKLISFIIILFMFFVETNIILAETLPDFTIMTEPWTPWQIEENGEVKGVAIDLLVLMLKRAGSAQNHSDIKMYPWARAYMITQIEENTILFSTTRTEEREMMFKWVGPIFQNTAYLIAKKDKHIKIDTREELNNYRIGTVRNDVGEQYLNRLGISLNQLDRTNSYNSNAKKLNDNRIDLIISGWEGFSNTAKEANIDPDLFEMVYLVDTKDICYAFYYGTPNWIIQIFQKAFDELIEEGMLDKLIEKYEEE